MEEELRYKDVCVVETLFLQANISSEMRASRNVLILYLNSRPPHTHSPVAFASARPTEYILNPILSRYTSKLSSSLGVLYSSSSTSAIMNAITSLAILIHNGTRSLLAFPVERFKASLHDKTVVKKLGELLNEFVLKHKYPVVVELLNLLGLILHEGCAASEE